MKGYLIRMMEAMPMQACLMSFGKQLQAEINGYELYLDHVTPWSMIGSVS